MKIKHKLTQYRRDFRAIYVCEKCEHESEGTGYDDTYFHENVIPNMECTECGYVSGIKSSSPAFPDHIVM